MGLNIRTQYHLFHSIFREPTPTIQNDITTPTQRQIRQQTLQMLEIGQDRSVNWLLVGCETVERRIRRIDETRRAAW
jgi:hypothetical protein